MKTITHVMRAVLMAFALLLTIPALASAAVWAEGSTDAGQLLGTAAVPQGTGTLTAITGSVATVNDADMYKIHIDGAFTATTVTGSDPMLFLMPADSTNMAPWWNDDYGVGYESQVTGTFPAGDYYLAISSYYNIPLNASGGWLGYGGVLTSWSNEGGYTFNYTINLTGASFVVDPAGMLATLHDAVVGVGPGTSLADKIAYAQSAFAAGQTGEVCGTLQAFINQVNAQTQPPAGKKLDATKAADLIAQAQAIQQAVGCTAPAG